MLIYRNITTKEVILKVKDKKDLQLKLAFFF